MIYDKSQVTAYNRFPETFFNIEFYFFAFFFMPSIWFSIAFQWSEKLYYDDQINSVLCAGGMFADHSQLWGVTSADYSVTKCDRCCFTLRAGNDI